MNRFPEISVVVPVYNSSPSLPALVARVTTVLESVAERSEIILVNDGSTDDSWHSIRNLASEYSNVRGLNLSRNYGQHNALLCGIRAVRHSIVVTLDDDLQNPPEEIPKLLATLQDEELDLVYGYASIRSQRIWRRGTSAFVRLCLTPSLGAEKAKVVSSFRAFNTTLRNGFEDFKGPFVSIDVLLAWVGQRTGAVAVLQDSRAIGESTYSVRKLLDLAFTMLVGFSTAPLRLASLIGLFFVLFGGGILVWVIGRYLLEGGSVPGFPFLASITSLFAGAQLFALGVMGEYLSRMYVQGLGKPSYVVSQETSGANAGVASHGS